MKKIYFLIPVLFSVLAANAKGTIEELTTSANPGTGGVLPPHFGSGSQSGTKPGVFRLVAKTYTEFKQGRFIPVDSTTYEFSNGRNGYTKKEEPNNDETVLFDKSYSYYYDDVKNAYTVFLLRAQMYDADNNITRATYSRFIELEGWVDSIRYLYAYDKGQMTGSAVEQKSGGGWMSVYASDLVYDGASNIVSLANQLFKVDFRYIGNKLAEVVDYNARTGWQPNEKKLYEYSGDNVSTYTSQKWNPTVSTWANEKRWEYVYDANNNILKSEEFIWSGSSWTSQILHEYTYDKNNNKLTELRKVWSAAINNYVNASRETSTYNMYNQPLVITTQIWQNGTWTNGTGDYQIRFYYDFPTSVPTTHIASSITTYPIPATDVLNVNVDLGSLQSFSIAIVDMQGRIVKQWQEAPATSYKQAISVAALPAGQYFIKLIGDETQLTERFVVNK